MLVTSTPAGIVVDIDGAQLVNVEEVTAADVLSVIDADSVLLSSTEIKDLIRRAKGSIAKRRIREALDILAPMLIEDFNNPEAYEAMLQLLRAVATQHPSPRNFRTLGNHLLKHKRLDEARNALAQAVELLGTNGSALAACEKGTMQVLLAISMPTFFESEVKLQEELASLLRRISLLSRSSELLFETAPAMSYTSFLKGGGREMCDVAPLLADLAFHGLPFREHVAALSQMFIKTSPRLHYISPLAAQPRQPTSRIRVGFVSQYLHYHPNSRMWGGIMINLPRDTIETTVVCLGDKVEKYKDPQWEYVRSGAEKFIDLRSFNFTERRNMLASQQFDVLVYVDSVMDTAVYFLGLARLAPIQCATWGLQMTSGSPEMDFFISLGSELPNAQEYYTETLIRFQTPGVFFHPPRVPSKPLGRQDFGLPQHKTLYVCPHNLRKVQYAYLAVVQGILERDSEAVVVFIAVLGEAWITTLLQRTLQRRLPAQLLPRIYILPTKSTYGRYDLKEDLYDLMMIADVLLDTFPFGGCSIAQSV